MAKYLAIPLSKGSVVIQEIDYVFDTSTAIIKAPVVGDDFYDPDTGEISQLIGQTRRESMTLTALLSKPQFEPLDTFFETPRAKDGSLTATHQAGESQSLITTILLRVRMLRLEYGNIDKLSNSPSKVTLEISYSGTRRG